MSPVRGVAVLRAFAAGIARKPGRFVVALIAGFIGLVAFGLASAAASPDVTIYEFNSHRYFSPNGDGQDDTIEVLYCLAESSNVTLTVVDAADNVVRTVESGVSHQGSADCAYWNNWVTWDGKDDAGQVVADGLYTLRVHAIDASGAAGDDSVQVGIDTRIPGGLTAPGPNDTVSGTVNWTFTPTAGFEVQRVDVQCSGASLGSATTADAAGTLSGSGDTRECTAGANTVTAAVYWTDLFGFSHWWTAAPIPVIVDNAPTATIYDAVSHRYFSPNGDAQDDTTDIRYCLSKNASVDIAVIDAAGATVRTLASAAAQTGYTNCRYWNNSVVWDGKDDAGQIVADAVYTVRVHAVDASGQTVDDSVQVGVDTRVPGAVTAPGPNDTLTGTMDWSFAPAAGLGLSYVDLYCNGAFLGSATTAGPGGIFTGSGDSTDCTAGANEVRASASWTDPFGFYHWWTSAPIPVLVDNLPETTIYEPYSRLYFSPNGDEQEDNVTVYYCLSKDASVDITVMDSAGTTVRTIVSAVAQTGDARCRYWTSFVAWDGMDDVGEVVADGVYSLRVHAVDASGHAADDTVQLGVDARVPGAVTAPGQNDTLSGTVNWAFTPTAGFELSQVEVYCTGASFGSATTADPGGIFRGSGDTAECFAGANTVTAGAAWTDPFGVNHWWSSPPVPVTVDNVPQATIYEPYSHRYFSPNGDQQDDATAIYYCLSKNATVDITVADAAGATVRTLTAADAQTGGTNCRSWNGSVVWDGTDDAGQIVADGVYTARVHAVDESGRTADDDVQIGVDTRVPVTLTSPKPGDTLAGLATFVFQPAAGYPISEVSAYFDTGGGATIYNASPDGSWRTSLYAGSLPSGPAMLHTYVLSVDPFGVTHWWSAPDTPVVVDVTSLPLTVTADPVTGPAPLATALHIDTSDPQARAVHYSVNFGDGSASTSGDVSAPYDRIALQHTYANPGVYRAIVVVTNSAGAASTRAIDITAVGTANTPPVAGLTLDATSGVAPLPVVATVTGTDADGDALTYSLDFGDGGAVASGSLPHAPVSHTYAKAGTYLVRFAISDGKRTTVRTTTVVVALSGPLAANAGDDQVVTVNSAVRLDGSASLPSAGIESYRWTFGDGAASNDAAVDHTYSAAGTYTATLTVTANGQTSQDTAVVTVEPAPTESGLVVTVTDENTSPIAGADLVVIDSAGRKYSARTDQSGAGHLHALPDGSYAVYGWKDGYLPSSTTGVVSNDAGTAALTLKAGQVATASLTSTPLTYDEIVAAGIDPDNPANQQVEEFTVNLNVGPSTASLSGYAATGGFALCPTVDGVVVTCHDREATFSTGGYTVTVSTNYSHGQPQLVWLVIPAKASWLKEFFAVQMMVTNLADPVFVLDHGSATLPLPSGLSLAPTASPQAQTVTMPDIPGGTSATATWIVRGDDEGFYDLASSYAGSLEPFGDTITVNAATSKPLHVWGTSAIEITIDADEDLWDRNPYHVRVGLKNVADVPIYNAAVELLSQGKEHYLYQPREALRQSTAQIDPGTTFWTDDYILAPDISGTLNLAASFTEMASGTNGSAATIITHAPQQTPQSTPMLTATGLKDRVGLLWETVPGATAYEIYSTPDRTTDFPATPLQTLPATATSTTLPVPQGTNEWFAIASIINGKRTLIHPIVNGTPSTEATQPLSRAKLSSTASCGGAIGVSASFEDEFFDLTGWTATIGNKTYDGHLSGRRDTASFTVEAADIAADGSLLSIEATDSSGATGRAWKGRLSKSCNAIKMLVLGDSIAWGQGLLDDQKYPALVKDWVEDETGRPVNYISDDHNFAHSGAVVDKRSGDRCGTDLRAISADAAGGEVPLGTPDIGVCQVTRAANSDADLILVDGCINDLDVMKILLDTGFPVGQNVQNLCGLPVRTMLTQLHLNHPRARIVYTGYYRIIDKVLGPLEIAQLVDRMSLSQAAMAALRGELMKSRSELFDSEFRAQAKENVAALDPSATWLTFADPGFADGDGLFGAHSKLFLGFNDPMYEARSDGCFDALILFPSLRRAACPFASLGHPDPAGAKLYRDAIAGVLKGWAADVRTTPKSLAIRPSPVALAKGDTKAISVTATYGDGTTGDASTLVDLVSDNSAVATVDGLTVRGVAVGQAHITATLKTNASIKAAVDVNVTRAVPKSLAVTPVNPLVAVGKNVQLAATVTMTDGTTLPTTTTYTWASGKPAVATVSAKGSVRGVAVGTASISATYKDVGGPITVTGSTIVTVLSGAPQVTGFAPASGPVGTQVTIQGANLLGVTSVDFGGVAAQFTVNSSSSITATVPARARTAAITVTSPLGTGKSKNKFTVR